MRQQIANAVTEEEMMQATGAIRTHINEEMEVYNVCVARAQKEPDTFHHYTFDFSQCVSLPPYSQQIFRFIRRTHVISAEKQLNFFIDAHEAIGKDRRETHGSNAVLSMIDYALESHCLPSETFTIHVDNCPGQYKNMYVIGYFIWRVMTGQQTSIEYLMKIPGHAGCQVDRSPVANVSVRYPECIWRDWKSFLSIHFKSFEGIRKYQHFKFKASLPGIVIVKEKGGGEETHINLLKDCSFSFPEPIQRPGYA